MRIFVLLLTVCCMLWISVSSLAVTKDLQLYLPFDGDLKDLSPNKCIVNLNGKESWVDGKFKKAMQFDGATYLEVPDDKPGAFDNCPGLTIGVWVYQETHHDNGIVVKLLNPGVFWPCSYNLETWSDQLAYFDIGPDAGTYATTKYPLNEWYYLVGVFDGAKGEDRIYVNGVLGNKNPRKEPVVPDGKEPIFIGCVSPGQYFFKGALDDLVIYNRALTEAEISENMKGMVSAVNRQDKLTTTWSAIKIND